MAEERRARLDAELPRLVQGLVRLGASKVILFGSMASGRPGVTSDVDLIAVMPTDRPFVNRLEWIWEELSPACADILVYTPQEFEVLSRTSPFVRHAISTGRVVHDSGAG